VSICRKKDQRHRTLKRLKAMAHWSARLTNVQNLANQRAIHGAAKKCDDKREILKGGSTTKLTLFFESSFDLQVTFTREEDMS
jgi:hypothetical protein